jgi:hypothetical protein
MATPVILNKASLDKHIIATLPPPPVAPATIQKLPPQYGCFTTVACHLDSSIWVLQNMPIHRWLLEGVFTTATLDVAGITVATAKARQFVAPGVGKDDQNKNAIVPVGKIKAGSKARQGRRVKFGITGVLATGLSALIATRKAPKPFGKTAYKGGTVVMPARITNPQIGAWFSSHLPVARLPDIKNGMVYTSVGTPIGVIDLSAPADFAKQFPDISSTRTGQTLQPQADTPVVEV